MKVIKGQLLPKNYWIVYVLKLQDDCWYVGRTTQKMFTARMNKHWKGTASLFTKVHKPLRVWELEIYPRSLSNSEAEAYENKKTIELAIKHTGHYVRGGGYCQASPHWPW